MWKFLPFMVFGFCLALACMSLTETANSSQSPAIPDDTEYELDPEESKTVAIFQETCPSVVFVTNKRRVSRSPFFFTHGEAETTAGQGSGFIWDREGHIVTNYHVIEGASSLVVTLHDRTSWEAEVVGLAPHKDLAVLKIDVPEEKLKPIIVGRSAHLLVGQKVLAIGDPYGLDQTLTTGVVSAVGRQIKSPMGQTIYDVIQTDAAINPGNSGGPLLDSKGRLIGVNAAILSPSGSSAGIGFAVPVDTVARVVPELIEYGAVTRPGLGIIPLADNYTRLFRLREGVIVQVVEQGSGADKAGVEGLYEDDYGRIGLGDVIIGLDKWAVRNKVELLDLLSKYEIGDEVTLHILRGGERRMELQVTLSPTR